MSQQVDEIWALLNEFPELQTMFTNKGTYAVKYYDEFQVDEWIDKLENLLEKDDEYLPPVTGKLKKKSLGIAHEIFRDTIMR